MGRPVRSSVSSIALLLLVLGGFALPFPLHATCGGGGGGGVGGITPNPGGGEPTPQVYHVPWKVVSAGAPPAAPGWTLYWFPLSAEEARASALQTSRVLALAAGRCIEMAIVPPDHTELRDRFKAPAAEPLVVLAATDGTEIGRVAAAAGKLEARAVEGLVNGALKKSEDATEDRLDQAEAKDKAGDKAAATDLYKGIWEQRCLFPKPGRKAAKALKKLGVEVQDTAWLGDGSPEPLAPIVGEPVNSEIQRIMLAGLEAELAAKYREAEKLYIQAVDLDPGDPTPLRFLAELYRHHTGEWAKSRALFGRVLVLQADPLSRAVALHGLGKMTIHDGELQKGVGLFEQSIATYPLALTYRNLAVFWYSEKQPVKAAAFVEKAMALEPNDPYNRIFAAVYLAVAGQKEEAEKIARANEGTLAASYNLAAIWAQLGDPQRALDLLRRHFNEYELFDAVRAREMKEARDDYMFVTLHQLPEFVELTKLAGTVKH
jgi:tetratricopeptide (TPR) repeat protein